MGVEVAIAGAALIGGAASIEQGRQARKSNRAAERAERARAARERANAIRSQRVNAAAFTNQAASGGTLGSSSAQGQLGALATNTSANIGFAAQLDELRARQAAAQERAARAGMIGNLASQAGQYAGSL